MVVKTSPTHWLGLGSQDTTAERRRPFLFELRKYFSPMGDKNSARGESNCLTQGTGREFPPSQYPTLSAPFSLCTFLTALGDGGTPGIPAVRSLDDLSSIEFQRGRTRAGPLLPVAARSSSHSGFLSAALIAGQHFCDRAFFSFRSGFRFYNPSSFSFSFSLCRFLTTDKPPPLS